MLIQHSELFIQDVYIDKPQLLLIQNGSMTVHYQHQEVSLQTGEMLVLNSGQTLGLTHQLSENGPFSCAIMAWDNALLTDAGLHTPAFKPPLITVDHLQVIPHVPGAFGSVPEPKPNARKCQGLRQTDGGTNSAGTCFG